MNACMDLTFWLEFFHIMEWAYTVTPEFLIADAGDRLWTYSHSHGNSYCLLKEIDA